MSNNSNTNHTLYSFRRCPYAMRARMGIAASGITVEIREIALRDKPDHMLEISPKATVPVLLLNDGTVIDESLDIMKWALNQNDPDHWLPADSEPLIIQNDTAFKHALDRYKYPNRYPDEDCTNAREDGLEILKTLNAQISQHGQLTGDKVALADIAIFPFIRQFAHVDRDWLYNQTDLKPLQSWLNKHLESSLFETIMRKYTPWKQGDTPLIFPQAYS